MEINCLDDDTLLHVLDCLGSDEDIARAAAVCRAWYRVVVEGQLWKRLCISRFPELKVFDEVVDQPACTGSSVEIRSADYMKRDHLVFCDFHYSLTRTTLSRRSYILNALHASSTDNFPSEDVKETLYPYPKRRESNSPSYWSSTGQKLETVPEFLTYRMLTPLCVVEEIKVWPFQAYFQMGRPIYSSNFVRFKFGYQPCSTSPKDHAWGSPQRDGKYVWKYVSPLYSMEQSDHLQSFLLPTPVVCFGGIFQVELVGRVQKQSTDQLYYICIGHVSVQGRALHMFDFAIKSESKFVLKRLSAPIRARDGMTSDEEEGKENEEDQERAFLAIRPDLIAWGFGDEDEEDEGDENFGYE